MPSRTASASKESRPSRTISAPRAKPFRASQEQSDEGQSSDENDHEQHDRRTSASARPSTSRTSASRGTKNKPASRQAVMDESMTSVDILDSIDGPMDQEEADDNLSEEDHAPVSNKNRTGATARQGIRDGKPGQAKNRRAEREGRGDIATKARKEAPAIGSKRKRQSAPAKLDYPSRSGRTSGTDSSSRSNSRRDVIKGQGTRKGQNTSRRVTISHTAPSSRRNYATSDSETENDSEAALTDLDSADDEEEIAVNGDSDIGSDTDLGSQGDEEGDKPSSKRSRTSAYTTSRSSRHSHPSHRDSRSRSSRSHVRQSLASRSGHPSANTSPLTSAPSRSRSRRHSAHSRRQSNGMGLSPVHVEALKVLLNSLGVGGDDRQAQGRMGLAGLFQPPDSPTNGIRQNPRGNQARPAEDDGEGGGTLPAVEMDGMNVDEEEDMSEEDELQEYQGIDDVADLQEVQLHSKKLTMRLERAFDNSLSASMAGLNMTADSIVGRMEGMMLSLGNQETHKHLATWREAEVKLLQVIQAKKEQLGDDLKMCDDVAVKCHDDIQELYNAQLAVVETFETQVEALFHSMEERMDDLREELRKMRTKYRKKYIHHTSDEVIKKDIEMDMAVIMKEKQKLRYAAQMAAKYDEGDSEDEEDMEGDEGNGDEEFES